MQACTGWRGQIAAIGKASQILVVPVATLAQLPMMEGSVKLIQQREVQVALAQLEIPAQQIQTVAVVCNVILIALHVPPLLVLFKMEARAQKLQIVVREWNAMVVSVGAAAIPDHRVVVIMTTRALMVRVRLEVACVPLVAAVSAASQIPPCVPSMVVRAYVT